jgi:hypothetical protein
MVDYVGKRLALRVVYEIAVIVFSEMPVSPQIYAEIQGLHLHKF